MAAVMEGMIRGDIERLSEVAVMPAVARGARCESWLDYAIRLWQCQRLSPDSHGRVRVLAAGS